MTHTLFINVNHPQMFRFYVNNPQLIPNGFKIRAIPVFSKTEHVQNIVRRCANHRHKDHSTNKGENKIMIAEIMCEW
jgi:hypothetical protein